MMVFESSTTTPLYLSAWHPLRPEQYAGTCIFLVVLGTITRVLLSLRPLVENRRWRTSPHGKTALSAHREIVDNGRSWLVPVERALYDVLVAALGYMLMLAVMTMNVGYFMAVLCGVFFGSLVSGIWVNDQEADGYAC